MSSNHHHDNHDHKANIMQKVSKSAAIVTGEIANKTTEEVADVTAEEFIDLFSIANNEPDFLREKRIIAVRKANSLPLPSLRYGTSIILNIGELNFTKLQASLREQNEETNKQNEKKFQIQLYIENKQFNEIRKQGVIICTLWEALLQPRFQNIIQDQFMNTTTIQEKECNKKEDIFLHYHQAYMNKTLFIYVPKNCSPKRALEIISSIETENIFEHIFIYLDENAQLTVIEEISSKEQESIPSTFSYRSAVTEIILNQNATLNYISSQSLNNTYYNINTNTARIAQDATMNWFTVTSGSKFTKQEIISFLDGKGARVNNFSLFLADKQQQFDFAAPCYHNAEQTHTNIIAKGAVKDKSKAVFRGVIHIKENATNATGYQKEDNLILDDTAEADAIPMLYIDNNDVKCSHGATIGQVDKEKLFYMQSRGISEEKAQQIIIEGFFDSLLKQIGTELISEEIIERIKKTIHNKLNN